MGILRILVVGMIVGVSGCAGLKDLPKTIWGSSTRVLEQERPNALVKIYEKDYWTCYKAALEVVKKKKYVLYKKDEVRGLMVIMGIPGSVNTTEVGVFFVELNDHQTRIELSSLSTNAKRLLYKGLFHGMDVAFGLAQPDQEDGFLDIEFQQKGKTPEDLLQAISDDGFTTPSIGEEPIDAVNTFLEDPLFYDRWVLKHRDISLSEEAVDLIAVKEKSVLQIKRLNRLLLEATYPSVCPVSTGARAP